MAFLDKIFENNRVWAARMREQDPTFFEGLINQQSPEYLWIGCSDSRVPANQIVGLPPGEVFVHRNVANIVVHTDFNCMSVLQYAVEVLKVKHIIVCGHYGCGGVRAALAGPQPGLIDNWLGHLRDTYRKHQAELSAVVNFEHRVDRLCELNVTEQVQHVCQTKIVQHAWLTEQQLTVYGLIYSIRDGLLKDLGLCIKSAEQVPEIFRLEKPHTGW